MRKRIFDFNKAQVNKSQNILLHRSLFSHMIKFMLQGKQNTETEQQKFIHIWV